MSYCSCAIAASACREIGLRMKSLRLARCWLSSSRKSSITLGEATTRNSRGLNWRASRRISRSVSYDILREILREARQFNPREFRVVASPKVIELLDRKSVV